MYNLKLNMFNNLNIHMFNNLNHNINMLKINKLNQMLINISFKNNDEIIIINQININNLII